MKRIYKFIFLGVGLGVHLQEIHKKIGASLYLIVEDNLEMFRLSLFVTDYATLGAQSELFFSVMENPFDFKESFNTFFHQAFIRNNYLKYALFYPEYKEKIRQIQNFIVTQSHLTYPHDKLLRKNIEVLKRLGEGRGFFDVGRHHGGAFPLQRPVILVAAGPSLEKEIAWLKRNAEKAMVVALFMTSPILEREGIVPDVVVHVDEQAEPVRKTLERMQNPEDFFKNALFFLAPSVEMGLFNKIVPSGRVRFFEDRTRYRFTQGSLEGFSVGEIAYALALLWGARELYLLGLDLALDAESKKSHASGHLSGENGVLVENSDETVSLRGSLFEVPGNFGGTVPTTPLFDMSIHRVNHFTATLRKPWQKVFNLGHGARFADAEPKRCEEIDFGGREPVTSEERDALERFFEDRTSYEMSAEEKQAMQIRIRECEAKIAYLEEFASSRYPGLEKFNEGFNDIASRLIHTEHPQIGELSQLMIIYLENVGGYVGDFLNTREIDNPKRHVKKLQKILAEQFEKIVSSYCCALKESEG